MTLEMKPWKVTEELASLVILYIKFQFLESLHQ